jgi:predicted O-methyltransferase YrrM
LGAVDRVLADPPQVHLGAGTGFGDLWATDRDCYEFLAGCCAGGTRTLETGLGASTVLFALWGTAHTCIVPDRGEVERCVAYCQQRGISTAGVRFVIGLSEDVLPALEPDELDVVLIDGGHGFPTPIIDWFYAGGRLRCGGILVLDDIQLPHVAVPLIRFLDRDRRWTQLRRTLKWTSYRRESAGALSEKWGAQNFVSFLHVRRRAWTWGANAMRWLGAARRRARRVLAHRT